MRFWLRRLSCSAKEWDVYCSEIKRKCTRLCNWFIYSLGILQELKVNVLLYINIANLGLWLIHVNIYQLISSTWKAEKSPLGTSCHIFKDYHIILKWRVSSRFWWPICKLQVMFNRVLYISRYNGEELGLKKIKFYFHMTWRNKMC